MPFIGQEPITGAYHVLDSITTSATATYNLQLNSGAFSPATANQLMVSLNGVIQKPGSSFTISGSQITFSSALTSSDSIDFIIALGDVLNVGTPTDGSVATAKIAPNAVTDAKLASTLDLSGKTVTYGLTSSDVPAGTVIQTIQSQFNITGHDQTTNTSFQSSVAHITIQKKLTNSKVLVNLSGGHSYVTDFANGCLATICQEGGSSTFTASTTYASGNDPASGATYGMQQVYNASTLNTSPHSINWLFDSTGNEFEAFRCFYKSRTSSRNVVFFESGHYVTLTATEIKQ